MKSDTRNLIPENRIQVEAPCPTGFYCPGALTTSGQLTNNLSLANTYFRIPEPETRNPKLEIRSPKLETR
jgi:hypothetical protein